MAKAGPARNDLDAKLNALYAASPAEFVNARNALAKSLDKDDAARVKALKKPSASAWAVNRLALSEPGLLAALVASGDRLRGKPSDLKDAMQKRRDALNEARKSAEKALTGAGHAPTPDVMRRVSATLEAIATFGSAPGAPAAGRLSEDVAAPGFDEVASLGLLGGATGGRRPVAAPARPAQPKAPVRPVPPRTPSKRDAARARALEEKKRREASKALAARSREAQDARVRLKSAEGAVEAIRRKKASLESALAEAGAAEKKLAAELAEARKASEVADAAERAAR